MSFHCISCGDDITSTRLKTSWLCKSCKDNKLKRVSLQRYLDI